MDTEADEPAVSEPPTDLASPAAMEVDETANVEPTNNSAGTRYRFNSKTPAYGNETHQHIGLPPRHEMMKKTGGSILT